MENDDDQTADNDSGAVVEQDEPAADKTEQNADASAEKMEQDATPEKIEADATDKSEQPEPVKSDVKENGTSEAVVDEQTKEKDTADDEMLAEKVDDMLADNEGDELIDLDKDGLLDDVSCHFRTHSITVLDSNRRSNTYSKNKLHNKTVLTGTAIYV